MQKINQAEILIIDKDKNECTMIESKLRLQEHLNVCYTLDFENGLKILSKTHNIKIILLDLETSGLDGLAMLKFIKINHPQVEVIIMTAQSNLEYAVTAMKWGAFEVLTKPLDYNRLLVVLGDCKKVIKYDQIYEPGILIVDDDKRMCCFIESVLRKQKSYKKIKSAISGEACLKILTNEQDFGLVLLDILMPGIDGIEVLKRIRQHYPQIEVIMISAHGTIERVVRAMKLGAFDFISKPIEAERLLVTVGNCWKRMLQKKDIVRLNNTISKFSGLAFISYAREDEERVKDIYQKLSFAGIVPWMDIYDILPGEEWEKSIENAILRANFFLACISNISINKRGLIQKEIRKALDICDRMLDSDIYFIPVRLEPCRMPEKLNKFQWVDYFQENGWDQLLKAIQKGLIRRAEYALKKDLSLLFTNFS